jgi:PrtD family type I secretion system ABC transporter
MTDHPLHPILARHRSAFVATGLFSLVVNVLVLTVPLYMLGVFSNVLTSRSADTLLVLSVGAAIALLVQGVIDVIRARLLARTAIALDAQLTPTVMAATLRQATSTSHRSAQPLRDAAELRGFLTGPSVFTFFDVPFAPLYLLAVFLLHPLLGIVTLAGGVALVVIALLNERLTRRPIDDALQASRRAQAQADEFARHADAIAAMGMVGAATERWRAGNGQALLRLAHGAESAATMRTLARMVRTLLQIVIYGVGAWLYLDNRLMVGAIVASSLLSARALAPLESMIASWRATRGAWQAYRRIGALIAQDAARAGSSPTRMGTPSGRIEVDQLVIPAPEGNRMLLRGVSFALEPGEFLGIVGPSGAGKSTLARTLVGLHEPRAGKVRLDGFELAAWDRDELGHSVGYLPQDVQLLRGTVHENIARLRSGDSQAMVAAAGLAGLREVVASLPRGFDTPIGEGGAHLSAGQRQQIGLARALYGTPRLVVLDEPDAHLDGAGEAALARALEIVRKAGATLVVITHRPSLLRHADKLLLLRNGAVERFGPAAQIIRSLGPIAPARPSTAAASVMPAPTPRLQTAQGDAR